MQNVPVKNRVTEPDSDAPLRSTDQDMQAACSRVWLIASWVKMEDPETRSREREAWRKHTIESEIERRRDRTSERERERERGGVLAFIMATG